MWDALKKIGLLSRPSLIFSNFSKYIYYPMKGYIRVKNKVNLPNWFRDIHFFQDIKSFHMWDAQRKSAYLAGPLGFFKLLVSIFITL